MVDIFAQEKIQIDAPEPQTSNDNDVASMIPKISASELPDPVVAENATVKTPKAPALPPAMNSADLPDLEAPATPDAKARDIFAEEKIAPSHVADQNTAALANTVNIDQPDNEHAVALKAQVEHDQAQMMTLAKTRFTPEKIASFKDNPIGFVDALGMLKEKDVKPLGGVDKLLDAGFLTHAAGKLEKGEKLDPFEEKLMNEYIDDAVEKNLRGFSYGGKIAYYGAQIPAFAFEFAMTAGVGKMAAQAVVKGAEDLAVNSAIKTATGFAVNAATRAAAMPLQYAPAYAERRLNDYAAITDKGELITRESTETPAVSALKAYGYTLADVVGQEATPFIGKAIASTATAATVRAFGTESLSAVLKSPITAAAARLPVALQTALYDAYKVIQPNAQISKVLSSVGWNGMLEQLGANRVSEIVKATIDFGAGKKEDGQEYTFDDYLTAITPNKDQLLVEAGLISIAGGVHASSDIAMNLMKKRGMSADQAQESVSNMSANEKDQFVQDNLDFPKSDLPKNGEPETINPLVKGSVGSENRVLPPELHLVSMKDLNVDAERFQFKSGGDENGVLETLKGVKKWEPALSEPLTLWQDGDGKLFVADGHQRTGLAQRLMKNDPALDIHNYAMILKESDGVTAEAAKAWAAGVNVAKGTGSAIDAAKVLRTDPELLPALPPKSALVRTAEGLAKTSDDVFRLAVNEYIDERYAAAIGRMEPDQGKQMAIADALIKSEPENLYQAEQIIRQVQDAGFNKTEQTNLFGTFESQESLFKERAKVLDRGIKALRGNAKALKAIGQNEKFIASLGNVIAKDANQSAMDKTAMVVKVVESLATRKGAVSDALNEAAKHAKETGKYGDAAKRFSEDVQDLIEKGLLNGDVERAGSDIAQRATSSAEDQGSFFELADGDPIGPEDGGKANAGADAEIAKDTIAAAQTADPPPINDHESIFNYVYRELWSEHEGVESVFRDIRKQGYEIGDMQDAPMQIALFKQLPEQVLYHAGIETFKHDENGNAVVTGKGLKPIYDDFDNVMLDIEPNKKTRQEDFENFLIARHQLHMHDTLADRVFVSPEHVDQYRAHVQAMMDKYGDKFEYFNTLGDEVTAYNKRTRDLRIGYDLTQEQADIQDKLYPYYIPSQRVMADAPGYEEPIRAIRKGFVNPDRSNISKAVKGSALEVNNILENMLRQTAYTLDFVAKARVGRSIDAIKDLAPDRIQPYTRPIVPKGKAKFKIFTDEILEKKLDKMIEHFGATLEEFDSMKVKGMKNVLGSYSPLEKTVRLRLGTTTGTKAHEAGHMLDFSLGLKAKMLGDDVIKKELQTLAMDRLKSDINLVKDKTGRQFYERVAEKHGKKYDEYIKGDREILANFFDAFVHTPRQVERIAPNALKKFQEIIGSKKELSFIKEIEPSQSRGDKEIERTAYGPADLPKGVITVWKDGKAEYLKVSKAMYESLEGMRPAQVSMLEKWLGLPFRVSARVLRAGATKTPDFLLRNPVKDVQDATIQSGVKYNPLHTFKAVFETIGKGELYRKWVMSGGKYGSFMALDEAGMQKTFKDIIRRESKTMKILKNPISVINHPLEVSEQINRVGPFMAAKKAGMSDMRAAFVALEASVNFTRNGRLIKKASPYVPFLNVGMQAADRFVRAFKKNPVETTLRGFTTLTVPALLSAGYYLYVADDKKRQEWLERPDWQTNSGIFFEIDGKSHYVPTAFSMGVLFAGIPQNIMKWLYREDAESGLKMFGELAKSFAGSLTPVNDWSAVIPPIVKAAMQDAYNVDFYTGRDIYPSYLQKDSIADMDKKNAYDTATAKELGKMLDISPALIDSTVRTTLAGQGRYVMDYVADPITNKVREARGEQVPERPRTDADIPVIRAFTQRLPSGKRSYSYELFNQRLNEATQKQGHYKTLDGPEAKDYLEKNSQDIRMAASLNGYNKQMKGMFKQIGKIYDNTEMSGKQKLELIQGIEENITKIARQANIYYSKAQENK